MLPPSFQSFPFCIGVFRNFSFPLSSTTLSPRRVYNTRIITLGPASATSIDYLFFFLLSSLHEFTRRLSLGPPFRSFVGVPTPGQGAGSGRGGGGVTRLRPCPEVPCRGAATSLQATLSASSTTYSSQIKKAAEGKSHPCMHANIPTLCLLLACC